MKRWPRTAPLLALLVAVLAYLAAAWAVPPGFFDGLAPPGPYRWVSPPPQFKNGNQPPLSGQAVLAVGPARTVAPGTHATQDGQAAISWAPGAFRSPPGASSVTFRYQPVAKFPNPGGVMLETNVYCITSTATLVRGQQVLITLRYSDGIPAPSAIYGYQGSGPWKRIGNSGSSQPFTISVRSSSLGCFAGGTEKTSSGPSAPSGQFLPLLVAILIVLVLLAGLPLVVLRRRGDGRGDGSGSPPEGGDPG